MLSFLFMPQDLSKTLLIYFEFHIGLTASIYKELVSYWLRTLLNKIFIHKTLNETFVFSYTKLAIYLNFVTLLFGSFLVFTTNLNLLVREKKSRVNGFNIYYFRFNLLTMNE